MKKIVVTYDIENDKNRKKVSDLLEGVGRRVNYSVFEVVIKKRKLKQLIKELESLTDKRDSIRFYPLDEDCAKQAFTITDDRDPFEEMELFFLGNGLRTFYPSKVPFLPFSSKKKFANVTFENLKKEICELLVSLKF